MTDSADRLNCKEKTMNEKRIEITVENDEQVQAILTALQDAEREGELDFPFNVKVKVKRRSGQYVDS